MIGKFNKYLSQVPVAWDGLTQICESQYPQVSHRSTHKYSQVSYTHAQPYNKLGSKSDESSGEDDLEDPYDDL